MRSLPGVLVACLLAGCSARLQETSPPPDAAELDDYLEGTDLMQKGNTDAALRKLRAFLREQPGSPYADDAQYAVGEAYYRARDFDRAIRELEEVPVRYPKGDRVPIALLRQAFAFAELGDETGARRTLQRLVSQHGSSPEAEVGRRKLAALAE